MLTDVEESLAPESEPPPAVVDTPESEPPWVEPESLSLASVSVLVSLALSPALSLVPPLSPQAPARASSA
ncbi:MAG: hypothetical protein KC468_11045, partial [Myxococcales bacterium]|nr:hypothetical protein [Myxococcales bacterium]